MIAAAAPDLSRLARVGSAVAPLADVPGVLGLDSDGAMAAVNDRAAKETRAWPPTQSARSRPEPRRAFR